MIFQKTNKYDFYTWSRIVPGLIRLRRKNIQRKRTRQLIKTPILKFQTNMRGEDVTLCCFQISAVDWLTDTSVSVCVTSVWCVVCGVWCVVCVTLKKSKSSGPRGKKQRKKSHRTSSYIFPSLTHSILGTTKRTKQERYFGDKGAHKQLLSLIKYIQMW
jgi:hypothetical protein